MKLQTIFQTVLIFLIHWYSADNISTLVDTKLPGLPQMKFKNVREKFPVMEDIAAVVDNKLADVSLLNLNISCHEVSETTSTPFLSSSCYGYDEVPSDTDTNRNRALDDIFTTTPSTAGDSLQTTFTITTSTIPFNYYDIRFFALNPMYGPNILFVPYFSYIPSLKVPASTTLIINPYNKLPIIPSMMPAQPKDSSQ